MSITVAEIERTGGMVKAKVLINSEVEVFIGYSGNASEETLERYLKEAAINQMVGDMEADGNDQA